MPRFLSFYKSAQPEGTPPSAEEQARMGALIAESMQAGVLLSAEGCLPSAFGARVRQDKGKVVVVDGPFAEAKEVVGGFAIFQAASKADAIAFVQKFLNVAGDGECEIRQLYEEPAASSLAPSV
jgi:hypothetical protein